VITYLSTSDIGSWFGKKGATVTKWRQRYNDFPAPDAVIGVDENGYQVHGWLPSREPEFRTWEAGRRGQAWRAAE
jgi:hypothetical protein